MTTIEESVGKDGENNKADVKIVQNLLNKHTIPDVIQPLKEDGLIGKITIKRIFLFQKHIVKMPKPDSRIDPTGDSLKVLSRTVIKPGTKNSSTLKFSFKGITLLKSIEELALTPYDDQTGKDITAWVKGATIGYGHLISKPEWAKYKNGLTKERANTLFLTDIAPFESAVKKHITTTLSQQEFDALVIFVFNIGKGAFASSSVVKMINNPNAVTSFKTLESAWKAWKKSQGKVMKGLVNRRNAEWEIYTKGIYKRW